MQLNIYAKFTTQTSIERSNTFARAVCAGELYDIYYSGEDTGFNYIIAAAAIVGPLFLMVATVVFITFDTLRRLRKIKMAGSFLENLKRDNLVAVVVIGIYISIYILILDILAVNIVRTSRHEYEPELSGRSPLNLVVTYITLLFDLVAFLFLLIMLLVIILVKVFGRYYWQNKKTPKSQIFVCFNWCKCENPDDTIFFMFPLLLVTPCICIISHFGYVILAWITEPAKSTTTLILYYILFFYLFLILQKSYKLGIRLLNRKQKTKSGEPISEKYEMQRDSSPSNNDSGGTTSDPALQLEIRPYNYGSGIVPDTTYNASLDLTPMPSKGSEAIDVLAFCVNIFLGLGYLGVAVIFIMVVYLMPLASEDLFDYLFNVIQFMIVVVSTQFAYNLLVGTEFSIKKVIESMKNTINSDKEVGYKSPERVSMAEEAGNFIASKILVPYLKKNTETNDKITTAESGV